MKLLALDTASDACTVALHIDGEVRELFEVGAQNHSARLLPMIDALLAEAQLPLAQLDAIAFGRGPGSFTGLRIGAGVVQGLCFGADLPAIPVSSLAALAQGQTAAHVIAAFDARMEQIYYGCYARAGDGCMQLQGEERVAAPTAVVLPTDDMWQGVGSGFDRYEAVLRTTLGARLGGRTPAAYPRARDVISLALPMLARGETVAAAQALPVYVRDDVARKMTPAA